MATTPSKKTIIPANHEDNRYSEILRHSKDAISHTISFDDFSEPNKDSSLKENNGFVDIFSFIFIGIISGITIGFIAASIPNGDTGFLPAITSFILSLAIFLITTHKGSVLLIAISVGIVNYFATTYLRIISPHIFVGLTTGIACGVGSSFTKKLNYNLFQPIITVYNFLSGDRYPDNREDDSDHDDITKKVYRRLILRHTILNEIEGLSQQHSVFNELCCKYEDGIPSPTTLDCLQQLDEKTPQKRQEESHGSAQEHPFILQPPGIRAYNLAVTDLFVEKALAYLNRKARLYSRQGFILYSTAFFCMISAIFFSFTTDKIDKMHQDMITYTSLATHFMISGFVKNFTFYGLIILLAVFTARMGKTLFAQAEQMKDRRHALRQGRLFVHLKGGNVTIEELERAFNWNTTQDNAFFHLNTEAQAPWGSMFKEMMTTLRETAKSSLELTKSLRKDG